MGREAFTLVAQKPKVCARCEACYVTVSHLRARARARSSRLSLDMLCSALLVQPPWQRRTKRVLPEYACSAANHLLNHLAHVPNSAFIPIATRKSVNPDVFPPSAPVDLSACDHLSSLVHSSVQASGNVRTVREKNEGERTGYAGPFPGDRVTHSDQPSHAPHRRRSCPFSPYSRSPHLPYSSPRDRPLRCPTRPAAGAALTAPRSAPPSTPPAAGWEFDSVVSCTLLPFIPATVERQQSA